MKTNIKLYICAGLRGVIIGIIIGACNISVTTVKWWVLTVSLNIAWIIKDNLQERI